jgi:hypothetical protein
MIPTTSLGLDSVSDFFCDCAENVTRHSPTSKDISLGIAKYLACKDTVVFFQVQICDLIIEWLSYVFC